MLFKGNKTVSWLTFITKWKQKLAENILIQFMYTLSHYSVSTAECYFKQVLWIVMVMLLYNTVVLKFCIVYYTKSTYWTGNKMFNMLCLYELRLTVVYLHTGLYSNTRWFNLSITGTQLAVWECRVLCIALQCYSRVPACIGSHWQSQISLSW